MTDQSAAFERVLARRLAARAALASRRVDAAAIARAAIATAPPRRLPWNGVLPMRASLAWVVVLTLAVAAVVGGALLVGALLRAPAPPASSLLAIGGSEGFFLASADGSNARQSANDGPYFVPEWSPDGTMVFASAVIGDEGNALRVFRADGNLFGSVDGIVDAAWSPDGRAIALVDILDVHLRLLDVESGVEVVPMLPSDARRIVGVTWSPDGRHLAVGLVTGTGVDGVPTLWILDASGGAPFAVPGDGRGRAAFPAWSPDGRRIAFVAERCDGTGACASLVRIVDAASGVRRAEVESMREPGPVQWSPDGSALAVDALLPDDPELQQRREVFVYTPADNLVRRVTDTPTGRTRLVGWAPDGASLLVARELDASGTSEAWQVELAAGEGRRLAADAYGVALQPVGRDLRDNKPLTRVWAPDLGEPVPDVVADRTPLPFCGVTDGDSESGDPAVPACLLEALAAGRAAELALDSETGGQRIIAIVRTRMKGGVEVTWASVAAGLPIRWERQVCSGIRAAGPGGLALDSCTPLEGL